MAKTEVIHVAVEPAIKAKLKQRSKCEGLSPSALIRIALRKLLEGQVKGYETTPVESKEQVSAT